MTGVPAPEKSAPGRHTRPGARGFTLLELVVAVAIFSLISVMALQVLTGALHQGRILESRDARGAEVLRALTLLRRDLEHLVPVAFVSPLGESEPAYAPAEDGFALSLGGQPRLPQAEGAEGAEVAKVTEAGFERVIWHFDAEAGTLSRQVWGVLNPRDPEQIGPELVQLSGVSGLRITPGPAPENPAETTPAPQEAGLPDQIEVEVETAQEGMLRVLVTRW